MQPAGLADQNLQARIRGANVMVRSNQHGWMALATGNKSELAVGYCTLYGDMAGGFAVLCDVFKMSEATSFWFVLHAFAGSEFQAFVLIDRPDDRQFDATPSRQARKF